VDDAVVFFGMVRLAQIVGEVEQARSQAADLAVGRERLQAAEALQAAVGQRLAGIAAQAAAARRALSRDAARAREQIAAAGITAREAVAEARAVVAGSPRPEPTAAPAGGAVIGTRLAQAVLVTAVLMFATANTGDVVVLHFGAWLTAVAIGDIVLIAALQLYHSRPARDSRRRLGAWPVTLGLQAVLVYAFSFSFTDFSGGLMAPFLAGSVLLLVPGWRRWAGYAAVVASSSVLYAALPSHDLPALIGPRPFYALFFAAITAELGLLVYGLSRLAGLARQLEGLHGELARVAAVQERLRVARDVHDLLGLGLSAVALKADLIGALIGRDDARAAAEIREMGRICAAARTDIRLVTGQGRRLSLPAELASAREILASAGIEVRADISDGPLPEAADEVLGPVLREAVTNILRHSAARTCLIELTADGGALRLHVANDGAPQQRAAGLLTSGDGGRGLANLNARVRAAGGQLASRLADGQFDLTAEIPLSGGQRPPAGLGRLRRPPPPSPAPGWPAGHR
jgi:two-component system sensor histidine kinase DesK